jgi:hypothetical protein
MTLRTTAIMPAGNRLITYKKLQIKHTNAVLLQNNSYKSRNQTICIMLLALSVKICTREESESFKNMQAVITNPHHTRLKSPLQMFVAQ